VLRRNQRFSVDGYQQQTQGGNSNNHPCMRDTIPYHNCFVYEVSNNNNADAEQQTSQSVLVVDLADSSRLPRCSR
jgi:hypothetical protein